MSALPITDYVFSDHARLELMRRGLSRRLSVRYFIHQGNALTFDLAVWSFNRRFLQNRLERCSCFESS